MKRIILVLLALSVLFPVHALAQRHGPGPGHGWSGHRPPPPPPAYHHRGYGHYRGHRGGSDPGAAIAAGIAGLAVGALAAGAMAAQQPATPPPAYYPPQGYYPPPPPVGYYPPGYTPPQKMCGGRYIPENAPCVQADYCMRNGVYVFCGYK